MKAHRLLPKLFCFLVPACLCFFLGLFMPEMNSSSVDADVQMFSTSKSSTLKLIGFWPCTIRPNHMWDYRNGELRSCIALGNFQLALESYQLAHSASNWNHASNNGNISQKLTRATELRYALQQTANFASSFTKPTTMIFDVFYVQCLYQKDLCRINSFGSLFCIRVYSKVFSLPIYWQKCFVLPTLLLGDVPEPSTQWVVRTAVGQAVKKMRVTMNTLHQKSLCHWFWHIVRSQLLIAVKFSKHTAHGLASQPLQPKVWLTDCLLHSFDSPYARLQCIPQLLMQTPWSPQCCSNLSQSW